MDENELKPLDIDVEGYKKRRLVADAFLSQYIENEDDAQAAIDALSELISYGGDLDKIVQMMALDVSL